MGTFLCWCHSSTIYYTANKMKALKGIDIDVQAEVQTSEINIIARSSSSTEDQLLFVKVRRECLKEMSTTLMKSTEVQTLGTLCCDAHA